VLWDVATRKRLSDDPLPVKEGSSVSGVAFSPDGKTIAAGSYRGVVLWDVAARKRLTDDPLPVKESSSVSGVAFSADGKNIAAEYYIRDGEDRGGVVLWEVPGGKRLSDDPLPVKEGSVSGVAFSPDGKNIAAGYPIRRGGDRGGVVLWEVPGGKRLSDDPLPVKEGYVSGVAFSPDGKNIAAGYSGVFAGSGGVVLWDVAGRKRLWDDPLPVKEGDVTGVAFSPDGKNIAAGYEYDVGGVIRGGVVPWDVATRRRLTDDPLPVEEGRVHSVAFSPDGKTIAAGYYVISVGGGVVLWDIDLESWQRIAGRVANRNFTWDEWRQFFPEESNYRPTFPDLPVPSAVSRNHAKSPSASSK